MPDIDRRALVTRHNVIRTACDPLAPLQVGNGRFAFGADITGLQSIVPFGCLSDWAWHEAPLPEGVALSDYRGKTWAVDGRQVCLPDKDPAAPAATQWLIENPARLNLGRIGLLIDDELLAEADLSHCRQELDLWSGTLFSTFLHRGTPVHVTTCCDPRHDTIAARVRSPLIRAGRLAVFVEFPYADHRGFAAYVGDWSSPSRHETVLCRSSRHGAQLRRRVEATGYRVALVWDGAGADTGGGAGALDGHRYVLRPDASAPDGLAFTCTFSPDEPAEPPPRSYPETAEAAAAYWPRFWMSGGAVDLSSSADARAPELERRIVLSQYLMAVNEASSLPPQESGLVNNGWRGKFHFEMYLWHTAHWALWRRWPLLRRSLGIYERLLPLARQRAAGEGFRGARWPKCTGPCGRESPHEIHALLVWQQPHVFFFAELDYRAHPSIETLRRWASVLDESAEFLASYPAWNARSGRYDLGPPLHVVSENTDPAATRNPAFELAYWRFGLATAQRWRERLGRARCVDWDHVLRHLAPLPVSDGCYTTHEGLADMWTRMTFEHPALAGVYGLLPGDGVDLAIMRRTAARIRETWQFERMWGWDFPLLAMCAARLGEPADAVDFLTHTSSRFQFTDAGLATGGPFPYFPSNGGLLYAVAMMCAGWSGCAPGPAPGFPARGWCVRWERLAPAL